MGSAAVFFEAAPQSAELADSNEELVVCFREVAARPAEVMDLLDRMPNTRDDYYRIRSSEPGSLSRTERAARVIYLNKTGFRGLWRVNRNGGFNVPYGAYDRPYYNRSNFLEASRALQGVVLSCEDYSESLMKAEPGDWVYLDPPYVPLGGYSDFKRYTSAQFREPDHWALAKRMKEASDRGVYVMLTNSDTPLVREIFDGFALTSMATRRDINLTARKRASSDLVISNYLDQGQLVLEEAEAR